MTDKELRRLSRMELIRLLLEQTRESERLRKELEEAKQALEDRRILISKAGSIAEASLQINQVMEAAQKAVDQYIENIEREYRENARKRQVRLTQLEQATKKACAQMLDDAQRKAEEYGRGAEEAGQQRCPSGAECKEEKTKDQPAHNAAAGSGAET